MTWADIKFFKPGEFDSKDAPGSGIIHMDLEFIRRLDLIRAQVGEPLRVNSGYRTSAHNRAVGGAKNSAHLRGHAADIHTGSWNLTWKVLVAAVHLGIRRIGVPADGTYIHLDMDGTLPSPRVWFYP